MSFQMIHMEIAYRLLPYLPQVKHPAEFILGSVAPDAVHMALHYEVGRKVKSHLFESCGPWGDTQDYGRWRHNIAAFYEGSVAKEAESARRDFALGICVHCLTDYGNDLKIWRKAQSVYLPSMPLEDFKDAFYREYRSIDRWLYQNSEHTAAIRELLAAAEAFVFEGLTDREELERMRKHLLCEQYDTDTVDITQNRFFTKKRLEDFMAFAADDIRETLAVWDGMAVPKHLGR